MSISDHLSGPHKNAVKNFVQYFNTKEDEQREEVQAAFDEVTEESMQDQLSITEVENMIEELETQMVSTLTTEGKKAGHQLCLYLHQVFHTAEQSGAALKIDTSSLNDALLMSNMEALTRERKAPPSAQRTNLVALDASVDTKLVTKVKDLRKENIGLKVRFEKLQAQMEATLKLNQQARERKTKLDDDLKSTSAQHATLSAGQSASTTATLAKLKKTREQLASQDAKMAESQNQLDGRITQSKQYKNYQKMLKSKNEMIVKLRAELESKSN